MQDPAPIAVRIQEQPDDSTCGPTALQAVYAYLGLQVSVSELISSVASLRDGGTLAVMLGIDALRRGYRAELLSYNLKVFDPSWAAASSEELIDKLEQQRKVKHGKWLRTSSAAYIEFLHLGGKIVFRDLSAELLDECFCERTPVLAGLSATYLYGCCREFSKSRSRLIADDVRGEPVGHFVILCGRVRDKVLIADPYARNPFRRQHYYSVDLNHLMHSILLGIVTYDANLLMIRSSEAEQGQPAGDA